MGAVPTPEEMKCALLASGYLLEQQVASELEQLDFAVTPNAAYQDPEEGKSREIDVMAVRDFSPPGARSRVLVQINCECKNNTNSFVVITRPKAEVDNVHDPIEYVFPFLAYRAQAVGRSWGRVSPFRHLEMYKEHYYFQSERKGVQFCKILRKKNAWEATHGGLYDGVLMPLAKATNASLNAAGAAKKTGRPGNTLLAFSLVVLADHLFELDSSQADALPSAVEHVSLIRNLAVPRSQPYLFDFVTLSGMAKFVDEAIVPFGKYVNDLVHRRGWLVNQDLPAMPWLED